MYGNVAKNPRSFSFISASTTGVVSLAPAPRLPSLGLILDPCSHQIVCRSTEICARNLPTRCRVMTLILSIFGWWMSSLRANLLFKVTESVTYMTTGKTIALTRWTFVVKVMSLLFNMLSRLVITFLPGVSFFNFMAAVTICSDFGAQENKAWHGFHHFPLYMPWRDGTGCHDLSFLNVEF